MKTSNKLLVSFFIVVIGVMSSLQFVVHEKEKNNEIETEKSFMQKIETQNYQVVEKGNFDSIKIENTKNVCIKYANECKVLFPKSNNENLFHTIENHTITIKRNNLNKYTSNNEYSNSKNVIIYCPKFSKLSLNNSNIVIDSFPINNNFSIDAFANNSSIYIGDIVYDWELDNFTTKPIYNFKKVNVQLNGNSYFKLDPFFKVENLSITALNNGKVFIASTLNVDSLKINLNDSTIVNTKVGVLKNLKFQ